eukprot:jgi/Chlat1/1366/Chrsp119S01783
MNRLAVFAVFCAIASFPGVLYFFEVVPAQVCIGLVMALTLAARIFIPMAISDSEHKADSKAVTKKQQ